MAPTCPSCGTESPPGFKFCGECGAPFSGSTEPTEPERAERPPAAPPPPPPHAYTPPHLAQEVLHSRSAVEGERKQVTVVFCDLVGSTALAERLGPEAMHLLLNRFFEAALAEVHRYEGTVNQFLGDGFMALFGAPVAHEDHARRAVLAALGLQKALRERRTDFGDGQGVELQVRMGLNTGWVVVGGIGDRLRQDYTAIGDTTNLAARLQQAAEPGTILVSEATARLLPGVVLEALGEVRVKGKQEPIRPFRVARLRALAAEETVLGTAALSPYVGREREMRTLEELRERAAAGEGQVLGIAAEAGSGKSRLLYESHRRAGGEPAVWLAGRCLSYGSGTPYLPLVYLLRNALGIAEGSPPEEVAQKLRASLAEAGLEAEEALPCFLALFGVLDGAEALGALSPQALQSRTFSFLRQWILGAGGGRLVIVEVEDLHWVDPTSEEFLASLVEGIATARVLLVFTYRPGWRPPWIEKSYSTQINLARLTERESREVLEGVLRQTILPSELVRTVLAKSDGNPFFLEELARSLAEDPGVSVPDTVQGVLLARIDRLPEEHKRLLQTASVLGREFPAELLAAVWQEPPSLAPLVADLKRWEFFHEELAASEPYYFFKHGLTQEAVYQTLLSGRRQALHAAAGRAIEASHGGRMEEVADRLAWHYSRARDAEKAVAYLALSAEKAARGYAHAEAAKALREALDHARRLPEAERDRRAGELALRLADSLLPLARFQETLELLEEHREAFERVGEPSLTARRHFWLAHTHSYLGDQEEASRHARTAIEIAREHRDTTTQGRAHYVLSRDAFWAGRFSEGIEHGTQAVLLLERTADRWWQGQAYWVAGFHHYVLGHLEPAFEAMERAEGIWRQLQDPRLDPSWSTGYFYASIGDFERGIELCRGGLERAQDPLNTAAALGFLGYAYLEKGDVQGAINTLECAVGDTEKAGMLQLQGWFSAFLAEAYLLAGRPEEAQRLAQEALSVTARARFGFGEALALRALGRIAQAAGDLDEAERRLQEARSLFDQIGAAEHVRSIGTGRPDGAAGRASDRPSPRAPRPAGRPPSRG